LDDHVGTGTEEHGLFFPRFTLSHWYQRRKPFPELDGLQKLYQRTWRIGMNLTTKASVDGLFSEDIRYFPGIIKVLFFK
jgi:hypothetical protein